MASCGCRAAVEPSKARITFDYSYALNLEEIEIGFDPENIDNTLDFRPIIRNHANGPVRYNVESFRITIGDRFFEVPIKFGGILPKVASTKLFLGGGFKKEAFDSFKERSYGTIEYSILYGHPEDSLSRKWYRVLRLELIKTIGKDEKPLVNHFWTVKEEADTAI